MLIGLAPLPVCLFVVVAVSLWPRQQAAQLLPMPSSLVARGPAPLARRCLWEGRARGSVRVQVSADTVRTQYSAEYTEATQHAHTAQLTLPCPTRAALYCAASILRIAVRLTSCTAVVYLQKHDSGSTRKWHSTCRGRSTKDPRHLHRRDHIKSPAWLVSPHESLGWAPGPAVAKEPCSPAQHHA